ncbi:MAG: CBS domain-containing protein [Microcoleus sp. CSU_2_2]|nr:CBS domain-containing protein [Microcoleus sp. SU_5_3]NJS09617.1 CBS domain-containing protein [Microcoleus sp. CSU_2_2]
MTNNPFDKVTEIYTPFEELVYVEKDSVFSELYYKMTSLGVRHCPVIDPNTKECFTIVSRRDLVKVVPPGNMLIPQEVQDATGIKISRSILINLIDELGDQKVGDLFPDRDLITVTPDDEIVKAVEVFSLRHNLGGKNMYISGLPVIEGKKLLGFISYTDVLKKFIKHQDSFLKKTIDMIATMSTEETPLSTLHKAQRLSDAFMRLQNYRSLPVVDKPRSNILEGFVEDVQLMACDHKKFTNQLSKLGVEHFMTPVERLYTPMSGTILKKCLDKFYDSSQGMYPPSTLAVCSTEDGPVKQLLGVLSYVDILKKWKEEFYSQLRDTDSVEGT